MERLAIHGGRPIREKKLYYGRQWISEEDIEAVSEVLHSDFLTCGPKVGELEGSLEKITNARHTAAVSNGTAALHCACIASGIGEGDEVITSPLTFVASANCALYCKSRPVFADIDVETYNIDPDSVASQITERTKAVIAVDFTGQAAKLKEIREICHKHGLMFIEDAAHAIGTKYDGKPIGGIADMTCFSFHPVKTVTSGEGGAVTTNDDGLYRKILLARAHGIVHGKASMRDKRQEAPWYYEQESLGYNYRMTDIQAALLASQLRRIEMFKARRGEIVARYNEAFGEIPEIILQKEIAESDTCRHLYIIRLDLERVTCTRRQFFEAMCAENIQPQVHYIPVYWFPYYQKIGYKKGLCPNAEKIYEGILSLPLYPKMTDSDVEDVIAAVKKIIFYYKRS